MTASTSARQESDDDEYRGTLAAAAIAIAGAHEVSLACHVSPDGDALGSMLGLHHVLRAAGVPSIASFSEPFVVAPHYRELVGLDELSKPVDFPNEPELMVTFDSGSLARLGTLEPSAKAARELVVIDHHVSNERYGTINVINPRGREQRGGARARAHARPATQPRRGAVPVRRAGVRYGPLPVRLHHASGVRSHA